MCSKAARLLNDATSYQCGDSMKGERAILWALTPPPDTTPQTHDTIQCFYGHGCNENQYDSICCTMMGTELAFCYMEAPVTSCGEALHLMMRRKH